MSKFALGIGKKIGKGSYKTVHSCVITDVVSEKIFDLPKDVDAEKLCIAVVDIMKLVKKDLDVMNKKSLNICKENVDEKIFKDFLNKKDSIVEGIKEEIEEMNDRIKKSIENEIDLVEKEIELQKRFGNLAPEIYDYKIYKDTQNIYFYILEEKCGKSFIEYIKSSSPDEDVFNKIVNLTQRIAKEGYINTDLKPENTCTKMDEGKLTDIIALDFDPIFFIKIEDEDKDHAHVFMLTLILACLSIIDKIKFADDIVLTQLNYKKIREMLKYFATHKKIPDSPSHPINMLILYCNIKKNTINEITDVLCNYIFMKTCGSKGGRLTKRSKNRSKKSSKNRSKK